MRPRRGRAFLVGPPQMTESRDQLRPEQVDELLEVCARLLKRLETLHGCEDRDDDMKKGS
jgi:hypothetical protein